MMPSAGAVPQAGSRIRARDVEPAREGRPGRASPQLGGGADRSVANHSPGLIGQTREFSATMGSMSASDAAPLPRLGEVFFDVRGDSRSMRLSWYADTGVAVFSIWQGGTCTGTFRLPIDDLTRMVEALRRGPQGPRARRAASRGQASAEQAYGRDLGSRDLGPGRGAAPAVDPGDGPDPGPSTVAMRPPPAADARIPVSRADAGYDGQPAEYHDEAAGYPSESGGYPSQPGGYPSEPGGYPSEPGGYSSEPGSYPGEPPLRGYREGPANGDYPGGGRSEERRVGKE